jgi:Glycosyltransferase Family 4/Glycosyl transferases group 1
VRIGIDARYAFREDHGGMGDYVAALLEHLPSVASDVDVFVAYLDGSADIEGLDDVRFQVRRLPVPSTFLWKEVALPMAASQDRLDLLHLPSHAGPTWTSCPTVYTIHDSGQFGQADDGPERTFIQRAGGQVMRIGSLPIQAKKARRVIAASDASRQELIRVLGLEEERIHVIPLGVAQDLGPATNPALVREQLWQIGHPVPARFVLALGDRDLSSTGLALLRAFARVHDVIPDIHLWIVGAERPGVSPIHFSTPADWLTILGDVRRAALVRLFQTATLFVYLSDGFGLPVLEAMSCGVPVLAPNRAALAEGTGGGAVLFDPANDDNLAGVLVQMLTDDEMRSASIRAGRALAGRYSEVEMVRRTYDVYREAVFEVSREAAEDEA